MVYGLTLVLFFIGLYGILFKKNLIKIAIGLCILEYAMNLLFALVGYRKGGVAPIVTSQEGASSFFVDPLPQALVLTAIVIGLGTTALLLAFAVRMYRHYQTFDVEEMRKLQG